MPVSKRDHLLAVAEQLFHDEGFHATGIDRIVSVAGVVRMTLYNHFSSKEALILAVLGARHQRFMARLDTAVASAPASHATRYLAKAHNCWLETCSQHGCIMVKAMGEFAEHSTAVHALATRAKNDLLGRIEASLTRDGLNHDQRLAGRLFMVLEGSNTAVALLDTRTVLADTLAMVDMLLEAARRSCP